MKYTHCCAGAIVVAFIVSACGGGDPPAAPKTCVVSVQNVAPANHSMAVGATQQFAAAVSASDCSSVPPLTWTTSASNIVSITSSGLATAVAQGSATITASAGSATSQTVVTVMQVPVASLEIVPATLSLEHSSIPGQLTAVAKDAQGNTLTGRAIAWQSLSPGVATASTSGSVAQVVTVSAGVTTIQASSEGRTALAQVTVTPARVVSVSVTAASTLTVGQTSQAVAQLRDFSGAAIIRPVAWSSSNSTVAFVHATAGGIVALAPGTTVFTATSEGVSGQATLTVTQVPVASVTVSVPASVSIGGTGQATVVARDAQNNVLTGRTVAWSSTNANIATVHPTSGLITGVATGTVTISATVDGVTGQGQVTVAQISVSSVSVTLGTSTLSPGQTTLASAITRDAQGNTLTGRAVTWLSLTPAVASVNPATGVVTAVAPGTAQINATSEGVTGNATVTVALTPVNAVAVTLAANNLFPGQTTQATATVMDAQGNPLSGRVIAFTSTNPTIATIHATTGLVTATGVGVAILTAASEGKFAQVQVTVVFAPVASLTLQLSNLTVNVDQVLQASITVKDPLGNTLVGRNVVWSVSDMGVATTTPGSAWTFCAFEGQNCAFSGTRQVRYGVNSVYFYRQVTGGVSCDNMVFEDPAVGIQKHCDFAGLHTTTSGSAGTQVTGFAPGTVKLYATVEGKTDSITFTVMPNIPMAWATVAASGVIQFATSRANGAVNVARTSTGNYTVTFGGMGVGVLGTVFTAHVTNGALVALGVGAQVSQLANCRINGFNTVAPLTINVLCAHAVTGAVRDGPFYITVIGENVLGGRLSPFRNGAFSHHANTGNIAYAPNPQVSWNSWGAIMSVTPTQANGTAMHTTGTTLNGNYLHFVSKASGSVSNMSCFMVSQPADNSLVECSDRTLGLTAPAQHFLLALEAGRPATQWAYASISNNTIATNWSHAISGIASSVHVATGMYQITFNGTTLSTDPALLLSNVISGGWRQCAADLLTRSPLRVLVACWDDNNQFANANFNLAFLQ